jgi:hypothetical protein
MDVGLALIALCAVFSLILTGTALFYRIADQIRKHCCVPSTDGIGYEFIA